jgi:oligopeptide transport system permease protein
MLAYIARRILETIPALLIIVTMTFFMCKYAPGGPFDSERATTPEIRKRLEAHYGLNDPVYVQYFRHLGQVIKGDFGPSYKYPSRTVNEIIAESLPNSMELGFYALLTALALGLTTGLLAAMFHNRFLDFAPMAIAMLGICLPTFVLGPLLILFFALQLGWFNVSGWSEASDRVLPALTLGIYYAAYVARLSRAGMLDVLSQDYIRTARAKGVSELRILFKHALRGGSLPVVSFLGPAIAGLITGSFVVETIFQIPGLGRYFVTAAFNRDYTMVMGTVIFYATLIILLNLIVDIVVVWLNPKSRFE